MLNVHFTVLAILELTLIQQCLFEPAQLAFPLFGTQSFSFVRRFAPRLSIRHNFAVDSSEIFTNLTNNHRSAATSIRSNPFYEFYQLPPTQTRLPQNDFIHSLMPVLQSSPAIEILNHYQHVNRHHNPITYNNDLLNRLDDRLTETVEHHIDHHLNSHHQTASSPQHLHSHQPILIHHHPAATIQHHYSFYHLQKQQPHPHLASRHSTAHHLPIINQTPFSLLSKIQQLKQRFKQQHLKTKQFKFDYRLNKFKNLNGQFSSKSKLTHHNQLINLAQSSRTKLDESGTTIAPLNENILITTELTKTGYLEIGSTAHLNQFGLEEGEDFYSDGGSNNIVNNDQLDNELTKSNNQLEQTLENKIISTNKRLFNESSVAVPSKSSPTDNQSTNSNNTGNVISDLFASPSVTGLIDGDLEQLLKQFKPNFMNFNHPKNLDHQLEKSKYAYDLIGSNLTSNTNYNQDINQNVIQVDFRERTAPDMSAGIFSRALGSLSNYLPSAMKITRTGCVGGTKCQFFLSCWMISSGSLGSSCGPLSTCCITPSKQDIQPAFYGPVINDPNCGRSSTRISRIVGGTDASFGQFPWQAFIQVGGSRCGGALVGRKHVVTAGHCVARSQHNPSEIRVTLGDYILNSDIESLPHEIFTVAEVKLHPNFRFTPQADRYDVAILVLDRVVPYRNNIKPICLPPKDASYLGQVAHVAGWGALSAGSKLRPKVLQHVNVPVIDNNVCEVWHRKRGINIRIHDEMICAGYQAGNKDACQGDSGGPLQKQNELGVWYLIGIVSAGYSCAKMYQPGIYHRVSSSSDWISSSIYQNSN